MDATLARFFPDEIAYEPNCEPFKTCSPDMLSFKGYVHRWLSVVAQVADFTKPTILPILRTSAEAAVNQCTGGASGRQCGFYWSSGSFRDPNVDETSGAGEAMNVLAAVSSLLHSTKKSNMAPVTNTTGGISKGDNNAGNGGHELDKPLGPITTADKVGAGILTVLFLGGFMSLFGWLCYD